MTYITRPVAAVGPAAGYPHRLRLRRLASRRRGGPTSVTHRLLSIAILTLALFGISGGVTMAALSEQEIAAVTKLGEGQGRSPDDMKRLIAHAQQAEARGLPSDPLLDKIKEGLAKGVDSGRIEQRLNSMTSNMEKADALLKETETPGKGQTSPQDRGRALGVLAEALGRGVTPDEVRSLHRSIGEGNHDTRPETLAYSAKGLAVMKEGGLPPDESKAVMAAASRHGSNAAVLDLARELKSRGQEFRDKPARLQDIRVAVERGERLDKLRSDPHSITPRPERFDQRLDQKKPDLARPEKPLKPERLETPARPDLPARHPDLPPRPDKPVRPDRPEHPPRTLQPH
jgi:hypothetical protein